MVVPILKGNLISAKLYQNQTEEDFESGRRYDWTFQIRDTAKDGSACCNPRYLGG